MKTEYFTEEQKKQIHDAAEKFRKAIEKGPQGQIEDGDSKEKIELMNRLMNDEDYRKEFQEKVNKWAEESYALFKSQKVQVSQS